MLAQKSKDWSAKQLKERHVIIKHVPILHQPACPGPNDMQMLWFIAVESKKEDVPELEQTPYSQQTNGDPELAPVLQPEILLKSGSKEG
jgi:hypothetical protein